MPLPPDQLENARTFDYQQRRLEYERVVSNLLHMGYERAEIEPFEVWATKQPPIEGGGARALTKTTIDALTKPAIDATIDAMPMSVLAARLHELDPVVIDAKRIAAERKNSLSERLLVWSMATMVLSVPYTFALAFWNEAVCSTNIIHLFPVCGPYLPVTAIGFTPDGARGVTALLVAAVVFMLLRRAITHVQQRVRHRNEQATV